jgi:hypothetical protein
MNLLERVGARLNLQCSYRLMADCNSYNSKQILEALKVLMGGISQSRGEYRKALQTSY